MSTPLTPWSTLVLQANAANDNYTKLIDGYRALITQTQHLVLLLRTAPVHADRSVRLEQLERRIALLEEHITRLETLSVRRRQRRNTYR